ELCARLRLRDRLETVLALARDRSGADPRIDIAEARARLALDDRESARRLLATEGGPHAAERALERAKLDFTEGDFSSSERNLDTCDPEMRHARALRLRASVHAARRDFGGQAAALRRVLDPVPQRDLRPHASL